MEAIPQNIHHQELDQIVGRMTKIRPAPAFEQFVRKEDLTQVHAESPKIRLILPFPKLQV